MRGATGQRRSVRQRSAAALRPQVFRPEALQAVERDPQLMARVKEISPVVKIIVQVQPANAGQGSGSDRAVTGQTDRAESHLSVYSSPSPPNTAGGLQVTESGSAADAMQLSQEQVDSFRPTLEKMQR